VSCARSASCSCRHVLAHLAFRVRCFELLTSGTLRLRADGRRMSAPGTAAVAGAVIEDTLRGRRSGAEPGTRPSYTPGGFREYPAWVFLNTPVGFPGWN